MCSEEKIIDVIEKNYVEYYNRKPTLEEVNWWIDNKLTDLLKEI